MDKDIDLDERTIYVGSGKGTRDRTVPISISTTQALKEYVDWRHRLRPSCSRFFIFDKAKLKRPESTYRKSFNRVAQQIGLRDPNSKGFCRSNLTVHDLRHSFAVNALKRVYETQEDVIKAILQLSNILGHERLEHTYWYIEGIPELISAAFTRVSS